MDLTNLNLKASLASTGRSNGTKYTSAERDLATVVSKVVLTATQHKDFSDDIADETEVSNTLSVVAEETSGDLSVPSLCRAVYRSIEKERLADDDTVDDFPKEKKGERVARDFTSVNLLFRKAFMDECGFSKEEVEPIFPSYSKNKKASA